MAMKAEADTTFRLPPKRRVGLAEDSFEPLTKVLQEDGKWSLLSRQGLNTSLTTVCCFLSRAP
jgi:hypothetical protein